jgi:hypothetical protein
VLDKTKGVSRTSSANELSNGLEQPTGQVFSKAFHLVMNKIGADLKDDLVAKLKQQGLQFDLEGNPQMSEQELEVGLYNLIGVGSTLIMRYIHAEMQKLE